MSPTPEDYKPNVVEDRADNVPRALTGNEVVISGMSAVLSKSDNIVQFMENLFNKEDMVTSENTRWDIEHPEIPKHSGKMSAIDKFDAQFFKVHYKQALVLDPMSSKLLEHTYGAIYDAGLNPESLRGKKVGVFIGATFSESEKIVVYEVLQRNGFGITGCSKAMFANRISYWLNAKGPSYVLDLACASSAACIEHAYRSIRDGECEAVIIGGSNFCRHPIVALNMKRAGFLCLDGKTKCFDKNGDGYVRSDATGVLLLQKAKDAKRIYSEVYYAEETYIKPAVNQFLPIPESKELQDFLEGFYSKIDVSPQDVEYIEASGTGIAEADSKELETIHKIFAKDRIVKVGSVKSNMGHSEAASGVCSLIKLCLAYHKGIIPANLHYYEPNNQIAAIRDGSVQVVTENTSFGRRFSALNSFSYSGSNVHVLLKGHFKEKCTEMDLLQFYYKCLPIDVTFGLNPHVLPYAERHILKTLDALLDINRYKSSIPYLILGSGRQEECVKKILDTISSQPIDPELIGLLHSIHKININGHMCRGYTIIEGKQNNETVPSRQQIEYCPRLGHSRPIWFVYSGMGSQWPTMGADLMRIPIFAAAIQKCHRVLEPRGVNIIKVLTDPDITTYDNVLNSFVGIAAVQIGLTDVLKAIGIEPDYVIGHSVGELGCAYADGCFTAEEMILSAYCRGLVSTQTPFVRGLMAAVGLGYKDIKDICPPEIEVACHNSSESSTISGPADIMDKFVGELTARGIFAKLVPSSNIAYHSRYIAEAGPTLLKYLSEVIKNPKPRTSKWLSSSVPRERWSEPIAKYSSAEYHTNNLLNPVLFEETSKAIHSNALVIEIAPHGLLQAILKRSLPNCSHFPLTRRGHEIPVNFLLDAFGKLYIAGLDLRIDALYPQIEFPVSTETPPLSHFVEFEHSEDWPISKFIAKKRIIAASRSIVISIHDDDYSYLWSYIRDDVNIFPEAAYLVLVWETVAMSKGLNYRDISVGFSSVHFLSEVELLVSEPLKLEIMIYKGSQYFEVCHKKSTIVTGYISIENIQSTRDEKSTTHEHHVCLHTEDIYKMMRLRGYSYENGFQSVHRIDITNKKGEIKWDNEWILFLDALLQFNALLRDHNGISTVTFIENLSIDTEKHKNYLVENKINNIVYFNTQYNDMTDITICGGVEMFVVTWVDGPVMEREPDMLHTRLFVPHHLHCTIDLKTALHVTLQIVCDNIECTKIGVLMEISADILNIKNTLKEVMNELPLTEFLIHNKIKTDFKISEGDIEVPNLYVVENFLGDDDKMKTFNSKISSGSFVLAIEKIPLEFCLKYKFFNVLATLSTQNQTIVLLNKIKDNVKDKTISYVPVVRNDFSWVSKLKTEMLTKEKIILVAENQTICGLFGMVKKLRTTYGNRVGLISIEDPNVHFDLKNEPITQQLQNNLCFNVLKKGVWGGYYYIPSPKSTILKNVTLTSKYPADHEKLAWVEASPTLSSKSLIQVHYAGVSTQDIQKLSKNVTNTHIKFGLDYSGVNVHGERVMGLVWGGALSTTVEADSELLWPVPSHWSLEDAATVPLPFVLAYYCLSFAPELERSVVFVNGGSEALGQAIIAICLSLDCYVYTSVNSEKEKKFLLKMFPELNERNILATNNEVHFMVVPKSNSKRCDLVINCLTGTAFRESAMKCVGFRGRILDISEHEKQTHDSFGMSYLFQMRSYVGVTLSSIFKNQELSKEKKNLQYLVAEGIDRGVVRPLGRVVYSPVEINTAFKQFSLKSLISKVLIRIKDVEALQIHATPRFQYSPEGTYIVTSNENELCVEIADCLIKRGARKIVLNISNCLQNSYVKSTITSWEKVNTKVVMLSENLQTEESCWALFENARKLGNILGIFTVQNFNEINKEDNDPQEISKVINTLTLMKNLDLISKKACAYLECFVVINYLPKNAIDEYIVFESEKICEARKEMSLPALAFCVNSIERIDFNMKTKPQRLSKVFNALETGIKFNYSNVTSFDLKIRKNVDLLQKVAKIMDIKDIEESLCFDDMMLDDSVLEKIKALIKEESHMEVTTKEVGKISLASLKVLCSNIKEPNTELDQGLGVFYKFIDENEFLASEPIIQMTTKLNDTIEEEYEIDPNSTYLMLIPGFDGHHQIFSRMCKSLKVKAFTLQLSPDLTGDSIQQMASSIFKLMQNRFTINGKFYLLGYSFGVNVALELACLLEQNGLDGVVYCLDSSPDSLRSQINAYLGETTDAQLQNMIVEHMYNLMNGKDSKQLKQEIQDKETWSEKIALCVYKLGGNATYSCQYKISLMETAYKRIKLAREYQPDIKLRAKLILIKGVSHIDHRALPEDYNLSKYSIQPVEVVKLESDQTCGSYDYRVSNIINRFLDPHLLEQFDKTRLCDTYIIDTQFGF